MSGVSRCRKKLAPPRQRELIDCIHFPWTAFHLFAGLRSSRYIPFRGCVFVGKRAANFAGFTQVLFKLLGSRRARLWLPLRITSPQLLSTYGSFRHTGRRSRFGRLLNVHGLSGSHSRLRAKDITVLSGKMPAPARELRACAGALTAGNVAR